MRSLLAVLPSCLLFACGEPPLPPPAELGTLVVALREGANSARNEADGELGGFQHDLLALFAQELGVPVRFVFAPEETGVAALLEKGRAHLAAANLVPAEHPELRFSRPIDASGQIPGAHRAQPSFGGTDAGDGAVLPVTAWAFPARGAAALLARANAFLDRIHGDGSLARLADRHFGHRRRLGAEDVARFLERVSRVLPHYRRHFVEAQDLHGIDWRLLAALAYQESRWEPLATSRTNVRGMMMLTEDTADRLGVTNRLDARQSILAGARYLAELKAQLPPETAEPDRTWLAVAAYNLGMGHLNGARFIATLVERDPNSWYEMKQVLPLLAKPEYFSRLKSGAGRGGEAVIMTENVRFYYDVLRRHEAPAAASQAGSIDAIPPM
jgi:membrane-bound lytic murein transglycosylase MltF